MEVPGYTIKRTIGQGGMATAHLAIQHSLQREVVLKTMNTRDQESADFLERFLNEGRIVASLRHPNIITIYDIGQAGRYVYIAMEYVEGGDLKHRIQESIAPKTAISIIVDIAQALEYAHGHGIIHRDVKPANILFRGDGTPLLSDFGIAKQVSADAELTSTGTILGSPFYMSPEQSEGFVVDGRTDIYSLGVILYEMLTGERPYTGDTAIKVIMHHIQSPLPKLPKTLSEYQPLLDRMMAKDRRKRLRNAGQLVTEARRLLDSGTDRTPAAGDAADEGKKRARGSSRRLVGALALVVLAVISVGGWYLVAEASRPSSLVQRAPGNTEAPSAPTTLEPPPAAVLQTEPGAAGGQQVDRADAIKALEWLAKNSVREDRLTQPPADNAYYYYSRLLALDPQNPAAQKGFLEIAERFVVLAEMEFSRKDYTKAQAYITLGLQVDPGNEGLESLRSFIENRERSFLETVLALLRGE